MTARFGNLSGRPAANPKHRTLVSSTIRQSARGEDCTLRLPGCNHDPETTVLAHLRFFGWSGVAQKPHDFLAVYACSHCHDVIDGRTREPWEFEDVLRALGATLIAHHNAGRLRFGKEDA